MSRDRLRWWIVILACAFSVNAQSKTDERKKCQPIPPPVSDQLPEPVKQHYSKLFKPDFAKLNLTRTPSKASQSQRKNVVERFNSGTGLRFQLITMNASEEEVVGYTALDPLILNRLQLCRDGELVLYRKGVNEQLEAKDRALPNGRSSSFILEPRKSMTEEISLNDWYESLPAGNYRLTVWHRFIWGGEWVASPSLSFEVGQ